MRRALITILCLIASVVLGELKAQKFDQLALTPPMGWNEPLLGVVTLEILGLVLNPFNRTLQPMNMLLA